MAETRRNNLIDPQVLADFLQVKLVDAIKLSPLVEVNRDLVGRPGSKLTLPKFQYVGDAEDLAEGEAGEPVALAETSVDVQVKKAFKAISITDEAVLAGIDPVNQIGQQLLTAMASKIEADLFEEMDKATKEATYADAFDKNVIADALVLFGEDIYEPMYLFINAKDYADIRKDEAFIYVNHGEAIISGHVGQIYGCEVVVTNRVEAGQAYIMKEGALALIMKRDVMVEADRDIMAGINEFACNEHYAVHLKYDDKVVKIRKA